MMYSYLMKWILLTQVIVLSFEEKPLPTSDICFEDCGSIYDVVRLSIGSCEHLPCYMPSRERVRINAEFECIGQAMNHSMRHDVKWILNFVDTKAYTRPHACDHNCLYRTPTGYGFNADVFVSPVLPNVHGTMEWTSINAEGENLICFRIPVIFASSDIDDQIFQTK